MRFFGTYYHSLDNKGRLVVPARFRDVLKSQKTLYLFQGFDGAIGLYTESAFNKELAFIDSLNYKKEQPRSYIRTLLASVEPLDVDNAGRITISVKNIERYNLTKDVVVIGVGDHLEVWSQSAFEKYDSGAAREFNTIAERLSKVSED